MLQPEARTCMFSSVAAPLLSCRLADSDLHHPGSPPPDPADWSVLVPVLSSVLLLLPPLPLLPHPLLLPRGRWEGTDEQWGGVVREPSAPGRSIAYAQVKTLGSSRFSSMPFSRQRLRGLWPQPGKLCSGKLWSKVGGLLPVHLLACLRPRSDVSAYISAALMCLCCSICSQHWPCLDTRWLEGVICMEPWERRPLLKDDLRRTDEKREVLEQGFSNLRISWRPPSPEFLI